MTNSVLTITRVIKHLLTLNVCDQDHVIYDQIYLKIKSVLTMHEEQDIC